MSHAPTIAHAARSAALPARRRRRGEQGVAYGFVLPMVAMEAAFVAAPLLLGAPVTACSRVD